MIYTIFTFACMYSKNFLKSIVSPQKVLWLIMIVFGGIFYTTYIANHYYFRTFTSEYANYNFAFWDYAHFHISTNTLFYIYGARQRTFLQDHFSLLLMYFVPVYWLLNWLTGSYTLMIILVSMILASAFALYKLIRLKTHDNWLAVISVLYYFLLQGHYSSFSSDCNIYTLAFCFVPSFLWCFESGKYRNACIVLLLFLFSREDMSLYAIFIFIVLLIWHRKERRVMSYCIGGIIVSIICFLLIFKILIPLSDTPQSEYNLFQYSAIGNTPWEALLHCMQHPVDTFKLFYQNPLPDHADDHIKTEFYTVYFISGGFLLFLRPQYFIWLLPILAQKMFNDSPARWGIVGYYCDGIVTMLPISIFLILSIFKAKWLRYSLAILVCVLASGVTWYKMNKYNTVQWESTTKQNMFAPGFFHARCNPAKVYKELALIPPGAKVCASESILPHLAQRKCAYFFPDVEDAEYMAVFIYKDNYMLTGNEYQKALNQYVSDPSWSILVDDPPFLLLKNTSRK